MKDMTFNKRRTPLTEPSHSKLALVEAQLSVANQSLQASSLIDRATERVAERILSDPKMCKKLLHPLSSHWNEQQIISTPHENLWQRERLVCTGLLKKFKFAVDSEDVTYFILLLKEINLALTDNKYGDFRKTDVNTAPDAYGNRVFYPSADNIISSIINIKNYCMGGGIGLRKAIISQAILVNSHPFHDGNGRVGRILFNLTMQYSGASDNFYIPLKIFSNMATGGYELSLREAEIFGRWTPLISYFISMSSIIERILRQN
ncbi:Fido domain-containing protein OS=Sphingobium scionense OX=1404341 GN=GGQ90_001868 PE=4 SV=1 [Sphingobium scionense]|uniref:Fido domain-containing protein n=1 Tax=Sphingobium scionense TaxID=1404341 RepID=A0A7W6PU81_9SPHN|nr:Fic family protein [Sphingobium scionense]MBB4148090.1 hypothetical protein [Sphingobium scionense]